MSKKEAVKTQVVVIGAGPGGYSCAFRLADLGCEVTLVEESPNLGGVCLNVGCIPSKQYLHLAEVLNETRGMAEQGIAFAEPKLDFKAMVAGKNKTVQTLTGGLKALAKQRKVTVVHGKAAFTGANTLAVAGKDTTEIAFEQAVIAVGSRPVRLPFLPEDPRIIDSSGALDMPFTKGKMLVLGGGIIGCEMATVYNALGVEVHIVELMDQLIPGADADLVKPLHKIFEQRGAEVMLKTKVTKVEAKKDGLYVSFEGKHGTEKPVKYDFMLESVGRTPNGKTVNPEAAGVAVDERGFIASDDQLKTNVPHIYAIGDVRGNPMLAHKAVPEGRLAAEVISGKKHRFDPLCIPSVAYTDPEIAWVGLTETEAKAQGINYGKGVFPWAASGRALSIHRTEGLTKLIFDEKTQRLLGAGICGRNAGEMISEMALAIEMGCDAEDIALTIHPHPTLSETTMMAAEIFEGTITDLYMPKKKK